MTAPAAGAAGGTVRAIMLHPDPVLRAVCAPAAALTAAQRRALVADLFATLYHAGGRGLAAPQIGVTRRVLVMDAGWKAGAPSPLAMFDPRIMWRSPLADEAEEMCLSIPGRPVRVRRAAAIRLAFADADGAGREIALDGAAARIAQHELDHLDGVLILDALPAGPGA
ncbi:peptide deformylase [Paracoccus contaminans]|uniref:peptide deformylase n=1 Tax=Paracoccus contaminans TaxID=1945662 RepID=UPI001F0A142E|nr:peptide deformylase [Paracoccus contaminans]